MQTADAIRKQARKDLIFPNARRESEVLLWEHSLCVAEFALRMLQIPGVAARNPNPLVALAGGLYHDADFSTRYHGKGLVDAECLTRTGDAGHRDRSAALLCDRLAALLPPRALEAAADAVRSVGTPGTSILEAQILSDADNMHQLGLLTLWPIIRHGANTGKGISDVIERWKTWKNYGYWTARRETFFFPEIQRLAEQRLERYNRFIEGLEAELSAADF